MIKIKYIIIIKLLVLCRGRKEGGGGGGNMERGAGREKGGRMGPPLEVDNYIFILLFKNKILN